MSYTQKEQAEMQKLFSSMFDFDVRVSDGRVSIPIEVFEEILVHIGDHLGAGS